LSKKTPHRKHLPCRNALAVAIVTALSAPVLGADLPSVTIQASTTSAAETEADGQVTITLRRDLINGPLLVLLQTGGDAEPGTDFQLADREIEDNGRFSVDFKPGDSSAELLLQIKDDISTEAQETIRLSLLPSADFLPSNKQQSVSIQITANDFVVTNTADSGPGSFRQALHNAMTIEGEHTVRFDADSGVFDDPQVIEPASPFPVLRGTVNIDGYIQRRLWVETGVTLSGDGERRVFKVGKDADVHIANLTIADGKARKGGGIYNKGRLAVTGVTFLDNQAKHGGAIFNRKGRLFLINSTLTRNQAKKAGGAVANRSEARLTNNTMSGNLSPGGGSVWSKGKLQMANNIIANSADGPDCVNRGEFDPSSTHNLIEAQEGCGEPLFAADPRLGPLGYYNGPAVTFPLGGGSPAINSGDNASALDDKTGQLMWDQRGSGDPRYVAGYTDLGAFEQQAFPKLTVDTLEDNGMRACTISGKEDCPLRGAIELANASGKIDVIRFDPRLFKEPQRLSFDSPLPLVTSDITLDASDVASVTLAGPVDTAVLQSAEPGRLVLKGITISTNPDDS